MHGFSSTAIYFWQFSIRTPCKVHAVNETIHNIWNTEMLGIFNLFSYIRLIATLKFGMSPILFELTIFWLFDIDIVATLENRFKVSFLFILPSSFKTIWHCIANDLKVFIHIKMGKKNVSIFFSLTCFDRHFWPLYVNSSSFFQKLTLFIEFY